MWGYSQCAISHGEGRFIANEELLRQLITNDQIATQYVDLEGKYHWTCHLIQMVQF